MMRNFFLLVHILCFGLIVNAQNFSYKPNEILPVDKNMVKGRLDNGLTYYIRKNGVPEGKAELRLVVNAGSILESDAERGLSHFLEHMSFNGTKHFPKTELIERLEQIGVRFGHELNAYTSFDETIFYLPIPADKIEMGLTVIQDWAMNLSLEAPSIDRERGVILEELRLGVGASTRVREKYLPVIFGGSKYPLRLPIGKADVIANFPYDVLRNYYKRWYRPDLIAVVVVGDIDPVQIEKEIQERFKGDWGSTEAPERPHHYVPEHKETRVVVATDPETSGCSVEISYKHRPKPVKTQRDYLVSLYHALYSSMINARLSELIDSENPPFSDAESGYSNYFRDIDTYSSYARCAPQGVLRALQVLAEENERMIRFGFSNTELDRAKAKMLARYERWYNERGKTSTDRYVDEYQVNFLSGQPIPGIEYEYALIKAVLPEITPKDIHKTAKKYFTRTNRTIVVTGPEGKDIVYPAEEQMISVLGGVKKMDITPYDEGEVITELMKDIPAQGTIVSEKSIPETGLVEWTLSNGVKAVFKKTDFKNNVILFRSTSTGGYSSFDHSYDMSAVYATQIQDESGVNAINNTQLKRLMAGKDLSLTQSLVLYNESMSGKFAPADMKEFFQLLYLYHTAPYFDEGAFQRLMKRERSEYAKLLDNPNNYFGYEIEKIMSNGNPRRVLWPVSESLDKVDFTKAQEVYKARFGNVAGFTYVFVGNIDLEKIKPYVLTYLASLPSDRAAKQNDVPQNFTFPVGPKQYEFRKGTDQKANVTVRFVKKASWDKEKADQYKAFIEILNTRLFEALRVEMSGVYGVRCFGNVTRKYENEARLNISFGTNTDVYEKLYDRAIQEIRKLIQEGPTPDEIEKVKEKRRVALDADVQENSTWLVDIMNAYRYDSPVYSVGEQKEAIERLTPSAVRAAGEEYIDVDSALKFILLPESN